MIMFNYYLEIHQIQKYQIMLVHNYVLNVDIKIVM